MKKHQQIKTLKYNYITDGIYIGNNQCCQSHFDEKLKKEDIKADISLEEVRMDAPSDDQLKFGITILEKLISLKKKVYIHCQNGHGRTSTLVAAYLIYKGKTVNEAIELIKTKRPSVHFNQIQLKALKDFYNL